MQTTFWLLVLTSIVSIAFTFDISSLVLFPNPNPKNYVMKLKEKVDELDEFKIKTGRARKLEPPRVRQGSHCPGLGFNNYDHLMLCQYWPTTLCLLSIVQGSYCKVSEVKSKYSNKFLIHGMWPVNLHRRVRGHIFPQCCNNSILFDWKRDMVAHEETRSLMEKVWPEILVPETHKEEITKKHGIWSHEWIKFGTCFIEGDREFATNIPDSTPVESYLLHAMRLRNQVDIYAALAEEGIVADSNRTYLPSNISDIVERKFGVRPELSCLLMKSMPNQVLYHIMLCIEKDELKKMRDSKHVPKLTNCSHPDYSISNYRNLRRCEANSELLLPKAADTLKYYYDLEDGTVFNYDPDKQQLTEKDEDDHESFIDQHLDDNDDDDDIWDDDFDG
jgi:ribonuclease I